MILLEGCNVKVRGRKCGGNAPAASSKDLSVHSRGVRGHGPL